MKKLEIFIKPEKLETLRNILSKHEYAGMTTTAVMGCGHQKTQLPEFDEISLDLNLMPKIQVMTVVWDEDVEEIITDICEQLSTGSVGDGKIFISDITDVVRIRTGERGEDIL